MGSLADHIAAGLGGGATTSLADKLLAFFAAMESAAAGQVLTKQVDGTWVGAAGASNEVIDDRVNALLVAGANVTKTYDDPANTLTLAAAAGGSETVVSKSAAYTAVSGETVLADATAGAFAITLPAATLNRKVTVKKVDATANAVTITPAAGTIDGAATKAITTQYLSYTLVADGTNWWII